VGGWGGGGGGGGGGQGEGKKHTTGKIGQRVKKCVETLKWKSVSLGSTSDVFRSGPEKDGRKAKRARPKSKENRTNWIYPFTQR